MGEPISNFALGVAFAVWGFRKTSSCGRAPRSSGFGTCRPLWRLRSRLAGEFSMLTPREELVRNWLIQALHDLATARKAASEPDPYRDTAIYHCQQAAEKGSALHFTGGSCCPFCPRTSIHPPD